MPRSQHCNTANRIIIHTCNSLSFLFWQSRINDNYLLNLSSYCNNKINSETSDESLSTQPTLTTANHNQGYFEALAKKTQCKQRLEKIAYSTRRVVGIQKVSYFLILPIQLVNQMEQHQVVGQKTSSGWLVGNSWSAFFECMLEKGVALHTTASFSYMMLFSFYS